MDRVTRCPWPGNDGLYQAYHDLEWGRPCWDERSLFELLVLEGAQAGLSWLTILRRREGYRAAFCRFDPEAVARFDERKVDELAADPRIIRNRRKIEAAITNARAWLALRDRVDPAAWLWETVGGSPVINRYDRQEQVPAQTDLSRFLSRRLKEAGFVFGGPTICYAFMQSSGMVCDHLTSCFCHPDNGPFGPRKNS